MYVHIARQPIFNANKRLFAYELLFRQTLGLGLGELSGDRATTSLLSTTFLTEGIDKVAGNKPCFINFTKELLVRQIASSFPKDKLIIEILEDVPPTPEVLEACRSLVELGYTLALDDFVYDKRYLPLIEFISIIKMDYRLSTTNEIERVLYRLSHFKLKFLAEKIETYEEFEHARKLGFHYFQGYFFARPEAIRMKEVSAFKANQFRLLAEINCKDYSIDKLEQIISADVAIAYKLLRYLNSAFFFLLQKVESIRRAITYLGEQEIRRFVTLVIVSNLAADKPQELLRLSLVRGRFCELLAENGIHAAISSELFLLGLFSMLDAILDAPMQVMISTLPLADEVKEAIIHQQGPFAPLLQAVIAYEQGQAEECLHAWQQLGVDGEKVYRLYLAAIQFAAIID